MSTTVALLDEAIAGASLSAVSAFTSALLAWAQAAASAGGGGRRRLQSAASSSSTAAATTSASVAASVVETTNVTLQMFSSSAPNVGGGVGASANWQMLAADVVQVLCAGLEPSSCEPGTPSVGQDGAGFTLPLRRVRDAAAVLAASETDEALPVQVCTAVVSLAADVTIFADPSSPAAAAAGVSAALTSSTGSLASALSDAGLSGITPAALAVAPPTVTLAVAAAPPPPPPPPPPPAAPSPPHPGLPSASSASPPPLAPPPLVPNASDPNATLPIAAAGTSALGAAGSVGGGLDDAMLFALLALLLVCGGTAAVAGCY